MPSKPLEGRVLITELSRLVEKKSKQTDLNDTPEPMSLPILSKLIREQDSNFQTVKLWICFW